MNIKIVVLSLVGLFLFSCRGNKDATSIVKTFTNVPNDVPLVEHSSDTANSEFGPASVPKNGDLVVEYSSDTANSEFGPGGVPKNGNLEGKVFKVSASKYDRINKKISLNSVIGDHTTELNNIQVEELTTVDDIDKKNGIKLLEVAEGTVYLFVYTTKNDDPHLVKVSISVLDASVNKASDNAMLCKYYKPNSKVEDKRFVSICNTSYDQVFSRSCSINKVSNEYILIYK